MTAWGGVNYFMSRRSQIRLPAAKSVRGQSPPALSRCGESRGAFLCAQVHFTTLHAEPLSSGPEPWAFVSLSHNRWNRMDHCLTSEQREQSNSSVRRSGMVDHRPAAFHPNDAASVRWVISLPWLFKFIFFSSFEWFFALISFSSEWRQFHMWLWITMCVTSKLHITGFFMPHGCSPTCSGVLSCWWPALSVLQREWLRSPSSLDQRAQSAKAKFAKRG